jgi:pimeloyl-ACP methyl ester carboxylesterase
VKAVYLPGDQAFIRYLEIPGDDPPLLWLHGWQCSATGELLPAAVQPALRGRRSLVVDFLGHGYSDKPPDFQYSVQEHARTILALMDDRAIADCGLVGHSMGGTVAVLVAAARPAAVSVLVMAEPSIDPAGGDSWEGQSEAEYADHGFADLVAGQVAEAEANPAGLRAAHLGMTRLIEPRAIYRERVSMDRGPEPSMRSLLGSLDMPRWYLNGELSDPEDALHADLQAIGVNWRVVPDTGHPMGLQNPAGFAEAVAEIVRSAWSS